jgi:hypothetical protein
MIERRSMTTLTNKGEPCLFSIRISPGLPTSEIHVWEEDLPKMIDYLTKQYERIKNQKEIRVIE